MENSNTHQEQKTSSISNDLNVKDLKKENKPQPNKSILDKGEKIEISKFNNAEFIDYCMNYSKYGALCQMVLIQAIEEGIKVLTKNPMDEDSKRNFLINPVAWNKASRELEARFEFMYLSEEKRNLQN